LTKLTAKSLLIISKNP